MVVIPVCIEACENDTEIKKLMRKLFCECFSRNDSYSYIYLKPNQSIDSFYSDIYNRIAAALCQIPSFLRDILLLYYYCDFTMVQIAALSNMPLSTVDYRHKQALRQLRRKLEAADEEKYSADY